MRACSVGWMLWLAVAGPFILGPTPVRAGNAYFPQQAIEVLKARAEIEADARTFLAVVARHAEQSMDRPSAAQAVLRIEGHLNSRDAALAAEDLQALLAFSVHARLQGSPAAWEKARQYLLAWARAYTPTGNPIDEEVFCKYVAAYDLLQDGLSLSDRRTVTAFMRALYQRGKAYAAARPAEMSHSNWESRHLALASAIAFVLAEPGMSDYVRDRFREQITYNILPGGRLRQLLPEAVRYPRLADRLDEPVPRGATFDFVQRDAVEYHVASAQGLVMAAWVARQQGLDWLRVPGAQGQTLLDALDFVAPYATGERSHHEFARSMASFDKEMNRGGLFDPRYAQVLLALASALDARYAAYARGAVLPPFERLLFYTQAVAR
jgi:hypothetical protein